MFCWISLRKPEPWRSALQSCFFTILVTVQLQMETTSFHWSLMNLSHISLVSLQNKYKLPRLTHEISGSFANSAAKNKIFQQVGNEGERHAENAEHQVADCQWQQKRIGDCSHPLVPNQHCDYQDVPQNAEQKYQTIQQNPNYLMQIWKLSQGKISYAVYTS